MFTRGKDLLQIDGLEVKRRETAQKTSPCFTQSPLGCNTIERRYSHNASPSESEFEDAGDDPATFAVVYRLKISSEPQLAPSCSYCETDGCIDLADGVITVTLNAFAGI